MKAQERIPESGAETLILMILHFQIPL